MVDRARNADPPRDLPRSTAQRSPTRIACRRCAVHLLRAACATNRGSDLPRAGHRGHGFAIQGRRFCGHWAEAGRHQDDPRFQPAARRGQRRPLGPQRFDGARPHRLARPILRSTDHAARGIASTKASRCSPERPAPPCSTSSRCRRDAGFSNAAGIDFKFQSRLAESIFLWPHPFGRNRANRSTTIEAESSNPFVGSKNCTTQSKPGSRPRSR